ncbi:MAG: geranyl transferase [Betaproteobacteria bacterium RBG_16_56_24]|nr:MAG: geranyl transferase [Betaproteobacteria bacterium RBG_16_56_24]
MRADFQSWAADRQARFEDVLQELLPRAEAAPQRLHQAMRYAVLDGGKRVRPLLAFAAGELTGADVARVNIAAAAVELIHAYSLVHDDMPCMDDDVLRRGKPTCHVQYDEATALLVGDSLQSLAFQLLAEHRLNDDATRQLEMIKLLAAASGSRGMAGGQAIDLASVGKSLTLPELEFMHIHKTGALIRAAILLGAYCGPVSPAQPIPAEKLDKLDRFGKQIGLAFQVVDDLLDCEADTATLGKTAGKDAVNDKPTYVTLLGIKDARDMARQLHREALDSLAEFGDAAQRLRELADFIVLRKF